MANLLVLYLCLFSSFGLIFSQFIDNVIVLLLRKSLLAFNILGMINYITKKTKPINFKHFILFYLLVYQHFVPLMS